MPMIPYGRQDINEADIQAVMQILTSPWLTQGPAIERFESSVADYSGAKYAVAVNNATAALHLACLALELGDGDVLWTVPNTFVASANCGRYCGAVVDFVDIDPRTYNMSISALTEKLELAKRAGKLPKVVVPVHFAGQSCEMATIAQLAKTYGFRVIEDAAHAIGGLYRDQKIGSCEFSDLTVFSFHPVKIITTGEGGMLVTNNPKLYQRLLRLRSHGITRTPEMEQEQGAWYYEQLELGFNYRMTDLQAALGTSQLERINQFVERRRYLARRYERMLQKLPLKTPWQQPGTHSAWHLYVVRLQLGGLKKSRRQIFDELRNLGIQVHVHYIPVYRQPYYQQLGFKQGYCPEAERYYEEVLTLPLHYRLTDAEQDYVVEMLGQVLG
ncbi:MAG TPA: UDP-4-amino-4,6-dideoxy-N-acetyl-beta-L-altrosamine transaminase [Bacillota bacterium]|nr:UDP-4-amino-4,6-dideoxy-N-acetyl-beta-L-altrosamine transaminase [Bacillota bacterium]